jgi:hypothetical protein
MDDTVNSDGQGDRLEVAFVGVSIQTAHGGPARSVVGLADCVGYLATHPDNAVRMGRLAQEYVGESFTPQQQTERALKIYSRIVEGTWGGLRGV